MISFTNTEAISKIVNTAEAQLVRMQTQAMDEFRLYMGGVVTDVTKRLEELKAAIELGNGLPEGWVARPGYQPDDQNLRGALGYCRYHVHDHTSKSFVHGCTGEIQLFETGFISINLTLISGPIFNDITAEQKKYGSTCLAKLLEVNMRNAAINVAAGDVGVVFSAAVNEQGATLNRADAARQVRDMTTVG